MTRRILMSILLLLVLSVPPVRAEEPKSSLADLLSQAWGGLVSFWMENGCIADPSGGCAARPDGPQIDNGCGIDPSGGCATGQAEITLPQSQDNGCGIDPDGHCRAGG
ncbi:MAG: hypothetical protein ABUT39_13490 [Acidobacteriota bacterium]